MRRPADRTDRIYAEPLAAQRPFAFDEAVADVFADMINRSIPGYQTVLGLLGVFASLYAKPGGSVYDLGCSLGASTVMLRRSTPSDVNLIAVDNAPAMVARCRANLAAEGLADKVEVREADILDLVFEPASLVAMNFTLQFVDPPAREPLLQRVHDALQPGGALLLTEKTREGDPANDRWTVELHHAFKKINGYSELEISQKRTALENVLQPDSVDTHMARLRSCGFREIHPWFRCLNFAGLIAIK